MPQDRNVIVTGATSGVGGAIVTSQLRSGANVVATGRRTSRLDELARTARDDGTSARLLTVAADLTSDQDLESLVGHASQFFTGSITAVVHSAFGHVGENSGESLIDVPTYRIRKFVDDSVLAAMLTVKAFGHKLRDTAGRFVFIIADWGLPQHNILLMGPTDDGVIGSEAYTSGKYAIAGLASSLELQGKVSVSAIYPGVVASWAGEDVNGGSTFLSLDSSREEMAEAGYAPPDDSISLADVASAVEFSISSSSTIRTLVLKPRRPDYVGL
jgi:NAD(P)-dependent dehydrogenase (short-subunit alcohol dehydrogenase family)